VDGAGFNFLPYLIGLVALAALAYFLLDEDDEGRVSV
jgi:hypothetical protein